MSNEIMTSLQAGYTDRAMNALKNLIRAIDGDALSNETKRAFADVTNKIVAGQVMDTMRQ
jgi:geranylgeranyl pyrophosphate synthase